MAKTYYTFNDTVFLQNIIDYGILPSLRYMICTVLYPDEMTETYYDEFYKQEMPIAFKRFVLADVNGNPDSAMKRRDKIIKTNNSDLPFTAYGIGEIEEDLTNINHNAKSYNYVVGELGLRVGVRPLKFQVPMISFFATSHDYYWAVSKLHDLNMSLTRYFAPITIKGQTVMYPFNFDFEITKGQYADAFEEQLRTGKIQDIVHTGTISFMDFTFLDPSFTGDFSKGAGAVYPVENIIYTLRNYYDKVNLDENSLLDTIILSSVEPTISCNHSGQANVSLDANTVFTFSERMNPLTFSDKIVTIPKIFYNEEWNTGETELTLKLYQNMNSGTAYDVSISKSIETYEGKSLQNDFEIQFTTI